MTPNDLLLYSYIKSSLSPNYRGFFLQDMARDPQTVKAQTIREYRVISPKVVVYMTPLPSRLRDLGE